MIKANKPIIGHNMMFDVMYIYHQFIGQLPDSYGEYAAKWNKQTVKGQNAAGQGYFKETYDTKVLVYEANAN
jgi:hypothetical protein